MHFKIKRPKELEDWQSSVPPEVVERAKKALVDNYKDFKSTANFIGVGLEDTHLNIYTAQNCHASMSSPVYREALATENGRNRRTVYHRGFLSSKLTRPFLEWFLNDSPYGYIILNRDDVDFCDTYGFVIAGDAPTTLVQCACIVSRHFYECYPAAFEAFNEMIARGIDGFIAYNIAFNSFISVVESRTNLRTQLFSSYGGHRVCDPVSPDHILNYINGNNQYPLGKTYKEAPSIYGSTKLFVDGYEYGGKHQLSKWRSNNGDFHTFMLEKEGKLDKSAIYRPPNPFAPKPPGSRSTYEFTCEQAVTVVADYCQQYISEKLNV